MNQELRRQSNIFVAAGLGIGALVLYLVTLSRGAFPGEPAFLACEVTGLFPRLSPSHPVWNLVAKAASAVPLGSLVGRLNVLSALCGAASIGLFYTVITDAIGLCIQAGEGRRHHARVAAHAGGVGAAVFLATSIPFWIVSNRAHTAALDILMLLGAIALLVGYARTGAKWRLWACTFLYAVGMVEFATFIIFFPLFGVLLLYQMWRHGQLQPKPVIVTLVIGLLGLSVCLLAAWAFRDTPGYELREYRGFWNVVWRTWVEQYRLITRSLPATGWLLVLILTAVPWLAAIAVARRSLNGEYDWAFYLLHVVMTLLVVGAMFNVRFAPWSMLGLQRLLVTPYALSASLFGYLLAYWYLLPSGGQGEPKPWKQWLGAVLLVPGGVGVICATVLNAPTADARDSGLVNRYAGTVLDCMDERTWLVADGYINFNIQLEARERGVPLKLIGRNWANSRVMLKRAADMLGSPSYANIARVGLQPLLREWLSSGDRVEADVALMSVPDTWLQAGRDPIPHGLVFLGRSADRPVDGDALFAYHRGVWEQLAWLETAELPEGSLFLPALEHFRRHASLVANNLGVLLEDQDRPKQAVTAYRKALAFHPGNVSALLNLNVLVERGTVTDQDGTIKGALQALTADLDGGKYNIWDLSRNYGYVRVPQAFTDLGWYWAATGKPGLAVSGLRKAISLLPDESRGAVKQALADVYLMQQAPDESEALYYELLVENPENQRALLGMARLAMLKGKVEEASTYLARAETAGVPEVLMMLERAALELSAGRLAEARRKLEVITEERPELTRAWAMLVAVLLQQNDESSLARCIGSMERNSATRGYLLSLARGHLAIMRNDFEGARYAFEEARRLDSTSVTPLEWLLRLDLVQGRQRDAERHALDLLKIDAGHAQANYVMASLHVFAGKLDLAQDSLRRSLARYKSPGALNDLAWLLAESGLYEEAETHVRAALGMRTTYPQALDTLGYILAKQGRVSEAEVAYMKALKQAPRFVEAMLHLGELYLQQGNREGLAEVTTSLTARRQDLTVEQAERLARLQASR